MQGKLLRKRVKEFSHRTNFYKLGLIRQYLKKQDREEQALIRSIPRVKCPTCGSSRIYVGYDESDYSSDEWLDCYDCGECFEDTFGYIDAFEELKCLPWCDIIALELYFTEPNTKTLEWKYFCETEIRKYLGLKSS